MGHRSLGCLSGSGIITALITLITVGVVWILRGGTLYSPGALNAQEADQALGGVRSHAETGGRCSACHVAPWSRDTMDERCLACHTEVASQFKDLQTLHGALTGTLGKFTCRNCHTDHGGAQAALTIMDESNFPHEVLGYSLTGHAWMSSDVPFTCADCHRQDTGNFNPNLCESCHRELDAAYMDKHSNMFGSDCLACHDGVDSYGDSFDHNLAAFPLIGKHYSLDCADCHPGAHTIEDLQTTVQVCYQCHAEEDPHAGSFGTDCAVCHTPTAWDQATFDHNVTSFPLAGKHANVVCENCHTDQTFAGTPQDCYSCHSQDDEHQGQFGMDCSKCHVPAGWDHVTFDHSLTTFPLTGMHVEVACDQCHAEQVFQGTPTECEACHVEPEYHLGLFGIQCANCHSTDGWLPAVFEGSHIFPINHGESGFSTCITCHPSTLSVYTCYICHDHTQEEIASKHQEEGINDFTDCIFCHPNGQKDEGDGD